MKLIIASPSPFARKVRIAMREKGIAHQEIMDVPWNPDTATTAHNPLGKVPVLILDNGETWYESAVILEYLETLGAPPALIPTEQNARLASRRVEALCDGICDAVVLMVLEAARQSQSAAWSQRQQAKIEAGSAELARLLDHRSHFVGDALSVADIAAGATLAYLDLRVPGFDWRSAYPNLVQFSNLMEARASFAETRPYAQEIARI